MTGKQANSSVEAQLIAGIAREVVQRLRGQGTAASSASVQPPTAAARLVTIESLQQVADGTALSVAPRCVITPAAREEARDRKITFAVTEPARNPNSGINSAASTDSDCPVARQLGRRGIEMPANVRWQWTKQPAQAVVRQCGKGRRAVMISRLSDVSRFADELAPQVWVLDAEHLNLAAAVNCLAVIAKLEPPADLAAGTA